LRTRRLIQVIAGKYVMGDRPPLHHDHADHDLTVPWLVISAESKSAQLSRASPFEVRGRDVVED
jgi:hypothetical protein